MWGSQEPKFMIHRFRSLIESQLEHVLWLTEVIKMPQDITRLLSNYMNIFIIVSVFETFCHNHLLH